MADAEDARTEPAGRRRAEEALRTGGLAPSRTLLAAASTVAALAAATWSLPSIVMMLRDLLRGGLEGRFTLASWGPRLVSALAEALAPTMAAAFFAVLAAGLWATRARVRGWSARRGAPPRGGAALKGAALATLLGLGVVALVGAGELRTVGSWAARGPALPLPQLTTVLARTLRGLATTLGVVGLLVLARELGRQERRRRQLLFLTPREAREQAREEEGAPAVRAARRARQQEIASPGKSPGETGTDA